MTFLECGTKPNGPWAGDSACDRPSAVVSMSLTAPTHCVCLCPMAMLHSCSHKAGPTSSTVTSTCYSSLNETKYVCQSLRYVQVVV